MTRTSLDISGMTCAACAARVEKVLSRVEGVEKATVNLALERAEIEHTPSIEPDLLVGKVEKAGYGATLRSDDEALRRKQDEERAVARRAEERQTFLRFALSAALSIPLVIGTAPMMLGLGHAWIGPWVQAALATGVVAISGTRFAREAFMALRGGSANMAVLVTLGTGVAWAYSMVLVLTGQGHGHLYFEAAAVVLTLVMLGKYLEARAKKGTSAALEALGKVQPREAERLTGDGRTETVPVEALRPGDIVMVRPGARLPVDGEIATGETEIDESLVTGESVPVHKKPGDAVLTGTLNGDAPVEIRVLAVGADTRLARMARLVEEAQLGEAPIQRLVDRISAIFVPVIIAIAAVTFAAWWLWSGNAEQAMVNAVAVLVIACPCALGLATPTALVAGTGAAARAGILIRDIETLERAVGIEAVAFDKTGTLTLGRPAVSGIAAAAGASEGKVLSVAAALEARSEHPLAKALVAEAEARSLTAGAAEAIRIHRGLGLEGRIGKETALVGTRAMMEKHGIAADDIDALKALDGTLSYVALGGKLLGAVAFSDQPRAEARAALAALHGSGIATIMLTGDNEAAARAVAEATGIGSFRAALKPEDKVDAVRLLTSEGRTAFVGDGMNDGPALASADLGIALATGTDLAREAAHVTLMRPDLWLVPASLDIAASTRRVIRQNLVWAFIYNVIGIPLAAFGLLSPVFAGAAMAFSSVSVVTNSARLTRWKPKKTS
ncbi:MAG: copper-translocating P-type ATPase [Brucellaceae bacterium]|nr:copper-translocating P-type ATPase [Brucellaceae bacterium]